MDPGALGVDEEREVSACISLAPSDDPESERLCGPPSAVPYISNSLCRVFRRSIGRKNRLSAVWKRGSSFLLLAAAPVPGSLRSHLVDRPPGVFGAVSVSHEYGQGAAVRDHFPGRRGSPLFQKKILALAAAGPDLYLDLRPVRAAHYGAGVLGHHNWRNREEV